MIANWVAPNARIFSKAYKGPGATTVTLSNGAIRVSVDLAPGQQGSAGAQATINGRRFNLGGSDPDSFSLVSAQVLTTFTPFDYKALAGERQGVWPPTGSTLVMTYSHSSLPRVAIEVIHEVYDGIATRAKWLRLRNNSQAPLRLNSYHLLDTPGQGEVAAWDGDQRETPGPDPISVGVILPPGSRLTTFRQFMSSRPSASLRPGELERLVHRRLAPWRSETPLSMVVRSSEQGEIEAAIEQAAEVGLGLVFLGPEYWETNPSPSRTLLLGEPTRANMAE